MVSHTASSWRRSASARGRRAATRLHGGRRVGVAERRLRPSERGLEQRRGTRRRASASAASAAPRASSWASAETSRGRRASGEARRAPRAAASRCRAASSLSSASARPGRALGDGRESAARRSAATPARFEDARHDLGGQRVEAHVAGSASAPSGRSRAAREAVRTSTAPPGGSSSVFRRAFCAVLVQRRAAPSMIATLRRAMSGRSANQRVSSRTCSMRMSRRSSSRVTTGGRGACRPRPACTARTRRRRRRRAGVAQRSARRERVGERGACRRPAGPRRSTRRPARAVVGEHAAGAPSRASWPTTSAKRIARVVYRA